jgi:predicted O-methyltransferase YrrM
MPDASPAPSSLSDPKTRAVLDRLHTASRGERRRLGVSMLRMLLARTQLSSAEQSEWAKTFYLSIGRAQGQFLYTLARGVGARRVVEFGTSFGVSTIYLAAAVRDNGGGVVIGSELHPEKVRRARANLEEAGLASEVEIREGDALETLRDPGGAVDLAFLDGWKELYVPVLELLVPHLRRGALVVGDNMFTFWRALAPYRAYVRDPARGFQSQTLFLGDGTELSLRV